MPFDRIYLHSEPDAVNGAWYWLSPEYEPVNSRPRQLTLDAASQHRFDVAPYVTRTIPLLLQVADDEPDTAFGSREDLIATLKQPGALWFTESGGSAPVQAVATEARFTPLSNILSGPTAHFSVTLQMVPL